MEFVSLIVNHIVKNGSPDKAILNDHPFNRDGNIVDIFQGKMEAAKDIVRQIDKLNSRIAISG